MPTRPTDDASFATDATLTGGAQSGLATRLRPSDALRAQGFYQDRRLPARILSWVLGHLGDWIAYLDNYVRVLDQGGTLLPTDNVNLLNSTGKTTNINGTVFHSAADGSNVDMGGSLTSMGHVTSQSYVRAPKRYADGAVAAGVTTYAMSTFELVSQIATGAAPGTIWQVDLTGALPLETMRFVYLNASFAVIVKDPSGATLASLSTGSGQPYAITLLNLGSGACKVIDISLHP